MPKTRNFPAEAIVDVVDSILDPTRQMDLSKSVSLDENAEIGSVIEKEMNPAF
jgi:hypothetical protein